MDASTSSNNRSSADRLHGRSSEAPPDDLYAPANKSWVWAYFHLSRSETASAWCNVPKCKPSVRRVARKRANTTGLIEHLRLYHNILAPSTAVRATDKSVNAQENGVFATSHFRDYYLRLLC